MHDKLDALFEQIVKELDPAEVHTLADWLREWWWLQALRREKAE